MTSNITWVAEPLSAQKFKGTTSAGLNYELSLVQAADGSTTTASLTLNSTNNQGAMTLPGDYGDVKAMLLEISNAIVL